MARKKKSDRPIEADITLYTDIEGKIASIFGPGDDLDPGEAKIATVDVSKHTSSTAFKALDALDNAYKDPEMLPLILELAETMFQAGRAFEAKTRRKN